MNTGFFFTILLPSRRRIGTALLVVVMALLSLALPIGSRAQNSDYSNVVSEDCIGSFLWFLANDEGLHRVARGNKAPSKPAPAAYKDCLDTFIEQSAQYEQRGQIERGKPPPPPPSADGPVARAWHAFSGNGSTVADASRLYLFAGAGSDSMPVPGDLWYYRVDLAGWILAPTGTTKPGPRQHVGFSCGAGQCVTSNGYDMGSLKETWVYNEGTSSWSQVNCKRNLCPSARGMPTMAYDQARSYHLLFGGLAATYSSLDDTYTFKGGRWTARNPLHKPEARHWAATVFAKAPVNKVVLFGGLDGGSAVHCNMYAWTDIDWQKVNMTNEGPCLYGHSLAWDEVGKRLIATGGYIADRTDTPNPYVWYFTFSGDGSSGTWSKEPAGSGLAVCVANAKPGARMAYDVPSKAKIFFGGEENINHAIVRYDTTLVCD